jgi:hypothetical protein
MSTQAPYASLKLVGLEVLVQNVAEEAYTQLQLLASTLPSQPDAER